MHDRESEQMQQEFFRAGHSHVFRFPIPARAAAQQAPNQSSSESSQFGHNLQSSNAFLRCLSASTTCFIRTLLAKVHVDFQRERPKPPTGGARASSPHANRAKLRATQGHRLHWPPRRVHTRMSDRCARARAWADPTFPGRDRATMVHETRSKSTNTSR